MTKVRCDSMAPVLHQNSETINDLSGNFCQMGSMQLANISRDDNVSLRNFSDVENRIFSSSRKSVEIVAVALADEKAVGKYLTASDNRIVVLGTICLENVKINLEELRRVMCTEIPCLPASFNFLSTQGWPIFKHQENKVKASRVICSDSCIRIKRDFEKHRVGIVTSAGDPIGFIFTDLSVNVKELRDAIEQQLKISQKMRLEYRFIERNGWPVMSSQEAVLSLIDIMIGQVVCIQNNERYYPLCPADSNSLRPVSIISTGVNVPSESCSQVPQDTSDHELVKRKRSIKFFKPDSQQSVKRKESEKRARHAKEGSVKLKILISYVRAEAAQYALDLKRELVRMGYNVYLDVHEIKTGSDWQDALNYAVTTCYLFVPLITPSYGKTQWTNREIKLADVLGKKIVPVNFMDHWPPGCLAIQFASTQYIPWKLQDVDHVKVDFEKSSDPRLWDPICVKRVARLVAESYKEYKEYYYVSKGQQSIKESIIQCAPKPLLSVKDDYVPYREDVEDKRSIVISAHPMQRYLAEDLKNTFKKSGHEVWCSVDLIENTENLSSEEAAVTNPNSPRNLPTIQEGDVFFSQNDIDVFNSASDKRTFSSHKEPEAYGRRPLSRLMSQFSSIREPSTLSADKLDHLRTFQQKVDQAAVVIVLVSEAYTRSTFSRQQVFYCEHRKRVVLVKCDLEPVPKWFRLLMGNDMITKVSNPQFECVLKGRVKRALNPASSETPKDATAEAKMNYLVNFLKRNLPLQDMCVYIVGSSKLQSQRAEEICKAIGSELAKMERVSLVTGGYFGAADITAKTFYECQESSVQLNKEESAVVHILPIHDSEDLRMKSRQNPDGSFEAIPYGKTVYLGDSVKERETVVARLLDTCIVIEGGPGVVHEVEEFIWNDHFVIPIMSTGGAAGGMFGVPVKIFELPPGVDIVDWSVLSEKDATPEAVAKAVVNIMISLKNALSSPSSTLQKTNIIVKRKSRKKLKSRKLKQEQDIELQAIDIVPNSAKQLPQTGISHVYDMSELSEVSQSSTDDQNSVIKEKQSWFKRLLRVFRRKNVT